MCRLMAQTDPTIPLGMRRLFMHELLMTSVADNNQQDGAGITDGHNLCKSAQSYLNWDAQRLDMLGKGRIWMGHVRSASSRTRHGTPEAHPFVFKVGDEWLYAAHNGGIAGTGDWQFGEPDVDSYRAFKRLVIMMNDVPELSPELLNAWTSTFGYGSEWTFMFMLRDKLHVARGVRPMYHMIVNNGLVFNTSFDVLLAFKNWLRFWESDYVSGRIMLMPEYSYTCVGAGDKVPEFTTLSRPLVIDDKSDEYMIWDAKKGTRYQK